VGYRVVVVDGMLGKLARWLRMLGVPALYRSSWDDEELLRVLAEPSSLLLTRDKDLARRAAKAGGSVLLLPQAQVEDLLAIVLPALGVEARFDQERALCPLCGSPLRRVDPGEVAGRVPERVAGTYSEFYVCAECGQVYWKGSHMRQIESTLEKVRWIVHGKVVC